MRLEGPIEGLIHISELVDRRIAHPKEVVEEGDVVPVKIVRIEYDRHRLGLSLKQARDKAEDDGWAFNASGGTQKVPQEDLERLGLTEMPSRAPEAHAEASAEPVTIAEPEASVEPHAEGEREVAAEVEPVAEPDTVASDEAPPAEAEIAVEDAEVIELEGEAPEAGEEPEAFAEPRDSLPDQESIVEAADEAALVAGEVSASSGEINVTEEPPVAFNNSGES